MNERSNQGTSVDFDPFAGGELTLAIPATEAQREVWTASKLGDDASCSFNESMSIRLQGPVSPDALGKAISGLVERHEALRTTFSTDGEYLCVAPTQAVSIKWLDHSQLSESQRASFLAEVLQSEVTTSFDLERGPLFRAVVVRESPASFVVILTAHHIVCDGWSGFLLLCDLGPLYYAARDGQASRLQPVTPFSEYAQRMAHLDDRAARDYWVSQYQGSIPVVDLPADAGRPPRRVFDSKREDHILSRDLVTQLKTLSKKNGVSFFTVLCSAWMAYLHRVTGETDLVTGIPTAGQSAAEMPTVVGHCVNLLPVRAGLDPAETFASFLSRMKVCLLNAFEHQEYTFGRLLKQLPIQRDPSRIPLAPIQFNLDPGTDPADYGFQDLDVRVGINPRAYENFELSLNLVDTGNGVEVQAQYNTRLFERDTVRRWLQGYQRLLQSVLTDVNQPVSRLSILDDADRQTVLGGFNDTARKFTLDSPSLLISRQAAMTPDRVAVRSAGQSLTYAELEQRANRLAQYLCSAAGVEVGSLVGVCVERSVDMLVSTLAIWKTGAAYVPLDPLFPSDRLAYMVEDAGIKVLVTQTSLESVLAVDNVRRVLLDRESDAIGAQSSERPAREIAGESRAYVIYTSGSTGKPKGVEVPHRAVSNFLQSMAEEPGMAADDVLVSVTTLSFDIAVLELYLPLMCGATTVIATKEEASDGQLLSTVLKDCQATMMQATPATWRLLLSAGWTGDKRLTILCGGEAFPTDLAQELLSRVGRVYNMYGPTETTVWSTLYRVGEGDGSVPIGRPIANTQVYVLDSHMEPVPVGVFGELFIGGTGVTLGYLNRPDLTEQRFVPNPFASGEKLYRTGDLVRFRKDGVLVFERRVDTQVKVRGYRIELGEIETALASHPQLEEVVVNVFEPKAGDTRLAAYFTVRGGAAPTVAELRGHLEKFLPNYMIPQHFVTLAAIPLTPNRKADRRALPPPDVSAERSAAQGETRAPRTATERVVVEAFCSALERTQVDVEADFFLEGGHSLLVSQMASKLSRKLDRPVPMRVVFDHPTPARLAAWLDASDPNAKAERIPKLPAEVQAPLSLMQERLWYLEQLNPGTTVFNTPSAHRLVGAMDEVAFTRAVNEMIRRQAVLRTRVVVDKDGIPRQAITDEIKVELFPAEDLSVIEQGFREKELAKCVDRETAHRFDLATGPLFHVKMFKLAPEEHVFFFMTHHIIWDGWCFDLLYEEMDTHYEAFRHQKVSELPLPPVSYAEFAAWHRGWLQRPEQLKQVDYWRDKLRDAPSSLDMPFDHPRPARQSGAGGAQWISLQPELLDRVREVGLLGGGTMYMGLLVPWALILHQFSGQDDIVIGTPVRGRMMSDLEKLMGFFVNALPLRMKLDPSLTFVQAIQKTRAEVLEAFNNEDAPFEMIVQALGVKHDESRTPIYQAFFSFQDATKRRKCWGNLTRSRVSVFPAAANQDLSLWFVANPVGPAYGCLNYNTDVFDAETTRRLKDRYLALLQTLLAQPNRPIRELLGVSEAEQQELAGWNDTIVEQPVATLNEYLGQAFDEHSARRAISCEGVASTFSELSARADEIAGDLVRRGVKRGAVVGLYYERSPEMLAALLGALRAGAAYLPLDPSFPPERVQFMLEDSGAALVLGDGELQRLGSTNVTLVDTREIRGGETKSCPRVDGEDVAYIIYTSGSTGKPKGVKVPHRAVVNFLQSMAVRPGLTQDDKLVAVTTLSFDIAVLELLLPLAVGAEIILAKREQAIDGLALAKLLQQSSATCMQATPATWRLLLETDWQGGSRFKALCGGEALPVELAEGLLERVAELWNMYGPTETTVWSTCGRVEYGSGGVSIGRPIANTTVHILDPEQRPVPVGVVGEMYIGGEGVTLGYHNRPELTAERFVADPFSKRPGAKLYRTGDLGRYRNDGELIHLGRTDFQVKVRGYRIELGEIEVALAAHPTVRQAVVVAQPDDTGNAMLVAYLTVAGVGLRWPEVRSWLKDRLPEYMVPSAHLVLDTFPLTPNGKVDRKALPKYQGAKVANTGGTTKDRALTPTEEIVASVWRELLGVQDIAPRDNFLDLGGHSLLIMRAAAMLEARTGKRVGPRAFIFETLQQIARHYDEPADEAKTADAAAVTEVASPRAQRVSETPVAPRPSRVAAKMVGRALSNLIRRNDRT